MPYHTVKGFSLFFFSVYLPHLLKKVTVIR